MIFHISQNCWLAKSRNVFVAGPGLSIFTAAALSIITAWTEGVLPDRWAAGKYSNQSTRSDIAPVLIGPILDRARGYD